jgi:hypothetical protein
MKCFLKALVLASWFALLTGARADPLPLITFTSSGTITEGNDDDDYFHLAGAVVGQKFTMSITIDPNTLPTVERRPDYSYYANFVDTAASKGQLTINGITYSWVMDQGQGIVNLRRPMDSGHEASVDGWGSVGNGMYVYASTDVRSLYTQFLPTADIAQNTVFDMTSDPRRPPSILGEAYIVSRPENRSTNGFVLRSTDLATAAWSVSPVPEPGQYAMLLVGVGALLYTQRKQRKFAGNDRRGLPCNA